MLVAIDWNFSVLYWNLSIAFAGFWLLWTWPERLPDQKRLAGRGGSDVSESDRGKAWLGTWPQERWQRVTVLILLVTPAGVYYGIAPHFLSHVLYSDHMPRGTLSPADGVQEISTWDSLHVPVPRVRGILRQYFEAVAKPGDKFHILDSRPALADRF